MTAAYDRTRTLTHSALAAFDECPQKFRLAYIAVAQPQFGSPEARRGTAIHRLLANEIGRGVEAGAWPERVAAVIDAEPAEDTAELLALIECIGDRYGRGPDDSPAILPVTAETAVAEQAFYLSPDGALLPSEDGAAFAGTIDLLYTSNGGTVVTVRDYKTGRGLDPRGLPLETDAQLRIYGYAASLMFPEASVIVLQKYFIRFEHGLRSVELAREDLAGAWADVARRAAAVFAAFESGDFPTRPDVLCAWCPVRVHCPAWSNLPALPDSMDDLADPQRVRELAWAWRGAKSKLDLAERALRAWVEAHGPIEVGGQVLDLWPSSKSEVDLVEAVRILIDHGVPHADILRACKLTRTELDKLTRGKTQTAKDLRTAIRSAIRVEPAVRFGWKEVRP